MSHNHREDDAVQTSIRNLFVGCVPEKETELLELWRSLSPTFQLLQDTHHGERFVMDAGAYKFVRFNHRAVRAFWLAGYIAWEGYRVVAENPAVTSESLDRFKTMLRAFDDVISSDQSDEVALPTGVAEPGQFPDKDHDPQGRAAAELATIAVGWALLHEVRHIQHQQAGSGADPYDADPTKRRQEEFDCDQYATRFLLDRIDDYARAKNLDPAQVAQKRHLGICFALFTLTLLAKDKWEASNNHPPVQDRIEAVLRDLAPRRSEIADAIAHTSFAVLRAVWPSAPGAFIQERRSE